MGEKIKIKIIIKSVTTCKLVEFTVIENRTINSSHST
jgi:hypothetical protein